MNVIEPSEMLRDLYAGRLFKLRKMTTTTGTKHGARGGELILRERVDTAWILGFAPFAAGFAASALHFRLRARR